LFSFCVGKDSKGNRENKSMPKKRNETKSGKNFGRGNKDHTPEKTPGWVYANTTKTKEKIDKNKKESHEEDSK
jgi:hypothetical protein